MSIQITVKDRSGEILVEFSEIDINMTVLEFKKLFLA